MDKDVHRATCTRQFHQQCGGFYKCDGNIRVSDDTTMFRSIVEHIMKELMALSHPL